MPVSPIVLSDNPLLRKRSRRVRRVSPASQQLIDEGVSGIHYYVLNKSQATASVLRNLRWDR